jgi:hypothetical protein
MQYLFLLINFAICLWTANVARINKVASSRRSRVEVSLGGLATFLFFPLADVLLFKGALDSDDVLTTGLRILFFVAGLYYFVWGFRSHGPRPE